MEFLVIILCLIAERFLTHQRAYHRLNWFMMYSDAICSWTARFPSWLVLMLIIVPVLFLSSLVLYLFDGVLFGFVGFILNALIFYYCLGPFNPFYSIQQTPEQVLTEEQIGDYLAGANEQLFAVILWYITLGPIGIIAYRMLSLCQGQPNGSSIARQLIDVFDFVPARCTALLYLLAGDFQRGFDFFCKGFLSLPRKNQTLLHDCGLAAMSGTHVAALTMRSVERLVEHATIILLVFLAIVTMSSYG